MSELLTTFERDWIISWSKDLILENDKELWAYKLILLYMSRIDPRVPDQDKIYFTHKELERFFDKRQIKEESIKNAFSQLTNIFKIQDDTGQWMFVNLFDYAGKIKINGDDAYCMMCSVTGKKYFFNLETVGYALSRLGTLIDAKSAYTISLYKYFLINLKDRKTYDWEISFNDIKTELRYFGEIENRFFLRNVIKKACTEINEISDIKVEYETITINRKLEKIKFNVKRHSDKYLEEKANKIRKEIIKNATLDLVTRILKVFNTSDKPDLINEDDALAIIKAADKYKIKTDELWEILAYVAAQRSIDNVVGYSISLIKKGYNAPKKLKKDEFTQTDMSNDLDEIIGLMQNKENIELRKLKKREQIRKLEERALQKDSEEYHKNNEEI